ncbi:hypothetical protein [Mesorhizobium sp.]|uniref:hypothetical protein n=1 Tax=Mesorhizobium sp. TaxID=1871066 RepID=UPI00257D3CA6|nr:hypothetical protein [Mesorhizobium sp.]
MTISASAGWVVPPTVHGLRGLTASQSPKTRHDASRGRSICLLGPLLSPIQLIFSKKAGFSMNQRRSLRPVRSE